MLRLQGQRLLEPLDVAFVTCLEGEVFTKLTEPSAIKDADKLKVQATITKLWWLCRNHVNHEAAIAAGSVTVKEDSPVDDYWT